LSEFFLPTEVGMKRTNKVFLIAAIGVLVAMAGAFAFLFRVTDEEHSRFGDITLHYRWGRVHTVEVDTNADGRIDYRAIWPGYWFRDPPKESWSDPENVGFFKYHALFDGSTIVVLSIDTDGDGHFEKRLIDDEARAFVGDLLERRQKRWPEELVP